jgi:2TM domain
MRRAGWNSRLATLFSIKAPSCRKSSLDCTLSQQEAEAFKGLSMRVFLAHLVAFLAGTLICAVVNWWLTPNTLWFPWVLIGWGALVATHALALLLRKTRRRERIFIDPKARSFIVHLFAYLATVLILFFVNLTATPKVWWFYWVALGWGAGIIAHGWCVLGRRRRPLRAPRPAPVAKPVAKSEPSKPKATRRPATKRSPRKPRTRKPKS